MPDTLQIGKIITTPQNRDAVHMAIVPVIVNEPMASGTHVGILPKPKNMKNVQPVVGIPTHQSDLVGILDPFYKGIFKTGEEFWLFLYPGSITSLRHEWTHPAFEAVESPDQKQVSILWLQNYCESQSVDYHYLMQEHHAGNDDSFNGNLPEEFKHHWFVVTGESEVPYFSCAC